MLQTLVTAAAAFVSTNIDDIVLLSVFFASGRVAAGKVVAGQYAGIGALVAVSLLLASVARGFATAWTRWLGLLPIAIGAKWLFDRRRHGEAADEEFPPPVRDGAMSVAITTIANGGDNVGVYVPLFATGSWREAAVMVAVFAALTALWCLTAYVLMRAGMRRSLSRYGRTLAPLVLISIGILVLADI